MHREVQSRRQGCSCERRRAGPHALCGASAHEGEVCPQTRAGEPRASVKAEAGWWRPRARQRGRRRRTSRRRKGPGHSPPSQTRRAQPADTLTLDSRPAEPEGDRLSSFQPPCGWRCAGAGLAERPALPHRDSAMLPAPELPPGSQSLPEPITLFPSAASPRWC